MDGCLILFLTLWLRILDSPQSLELLLIDLPGLSIGSVRVLSLPDGGVWLMKQDTVHFLPTAGLTMLLDSHCIPWGPHFPSNELSISNEAEVMGGPTQLNALILYLQAGVKSREPPWSQQKSMVLSPRVSVGTPFLIRISQHDGL